MPQAKTTTPTFIMELPLVLSDSEALLFAKTFEFARHIYNATPVSYTHLTLPTMEAV